MQNKTVWVLADDRAGNTAQSLGVAEALGFQIEMKPIVYNRFVKLPNLIRGKTTIGLTKKSKQALKPPFPDVVIAAGRRAAPVLRSIKKLSKGKTKIVQLMFPDNVGLSEFDLIVLPNHDGCKLELPQIMRITGTTHRITKKRLEEEKLKWEDAFQGMPEKRLALIVGGATKAMDFSPEMAKNLVEQTKELAAQKGVRSILVTTSRRTGVLQEKMIKENLEEPFYFYSWSNKEVENPYFGYLSLCDYIVVTGDSMSMCSEACASNAEVYLFAPEDKIGKKHKRLHQELYALGYAKPLVKSLQGTQPSPEGLSERVQEKELSKEPLNASKQVADRIKQMLD